ncbi:MAG TPA: S41 family peptidase [Chitinophagaceae bacterium]|nr:S41 family peptidase [Chitinophagaceae bacterium]
MKNFYFILLIIFLTSCGVNNHTSFSPKRKFSVQKMQEDYSILRNIYEKSHPGIYWYTSKDSMDYFFDSGYTKIKDSMTEPEFKNLLSQTIQHIKCGHSSTKYSRKYDYHLFNNRLPQFPLQLKVLNDSLVMLFNAHRKDSLFYRGAIITSINGYKAKKIIDTLCSVISTDGVSLNFKYQQITNNFPYYYSGVFGVQKDYTIKYITKEGIESTTTIKAYKPAEDSLRRIGITASLIPKKTKKQVRQEKRLQTFSASIDTFNKLAILNVNTFGSNLKRRFIKRAFKQIKNSGIQHIAIDLRLNGGGLINKSIYLARYLKNSPFRFMDSVVAVNNKLTSGKYIHHRFVYTVGLWFLTKKGRDGNYHFRLFENRLYSPKKQNFFKGKIYLLTGGNTFSAASLFASSLKGQANVVVVGEETGGGYYGNNGVFIPDIVLPNTHIRVRLPLFRVVNNKSFTKDGHGVKPDIEVMPTVQTIMRNIDPKMEKIRELVKQNQ